AIQIHVAWRALPVAALIAGSLFLLVNILLMPSALEIDPLLLLRYQASLVMGSGVLLSSDASVIVVGIIVHYVLALVFTLIITIVIHRWGLVVGIIGGAILGLAIYGINLYTMTLFFPWFFAINNNILLASHVVFGAAAGGIYELLDTYDLPIEGARTDVST
ncbi:MAG: hypothetical protein IT319_05840, partial [Anaerolineae bacterium]|nr:hypothetical protein [Anaerolineae bacterium]